jgi:alpha-L-fucosidase
MPREKNHSILQPSNRRAFLKAAVAVAAGAPVIETLPLACKVRAAGDAAVNGSGWEKIIMAADPLMVNSVPSPAQLRYQTNQYGAFLHYGPAVFLEGKWDIVADPKVFDPTELDVEQWVRVAKSFDAKHLVFSTKHHNGFCLWPTRTTDYSVRSSPWKNGRGDVIRDVADACKKHGIGLGLYYSGQDRHFPCFADNPSVANRAAYWPVYKQQLNELMSNYGELVCLWLDSYLDPFQPDVINPATGKPYGGEIIAMAKAKQPNMVIWGGSQTTLASCSPKEDGIAPDPLWNVVRKGQIPPGYAAPWTEGWVVPEAYNCCGTFAQTVFSPQELMDQYYKSVGRGANFLQSLVPDKRGLIQDTAVKNLAQFGAEVRRRFGSPIARTDSRHAWLEPGVLDIAFGGAKKITHVVLEEEIAKGQHVLKYSIDVSTGGNWKTVAEGQSIGRERIERFQPPITAKKVRFRVTQANAIPSISAMMVCDK